MSRPIRTAALALGLALLVACTAAPSVAQAPPASRAAASAQPPAARRTRAQESAPAPAPTTPGGLVACTDPRPSACTMEHAPVCATRDTGIRCITTPCPSSEQKTYDTGCAACSDPKVSSWVKGACPGS